MTIKYKAVRQSKPGLKGGGDYKYYPRIRARRKVDLGDLSKLISSRSTLHTADIMATLTALVEVIPELLLDNSIIQLGELGTFSLHIKGTAVDTPEQVNRTAITDVKIAFLSSPLVKQKLRKASFTKQS